MPERRSGSVSADSLPEEPRSLRMHPSRIFPQQAYVEFTRSGPLLQFITKEGLTPLGPHPGPMKTELSSHGYIQ